MDAIEIVDYRDEHAAAFERLNREWIERLFGMEEPDRELLGDPHGKIVEPGGHVLFARLDGEVVGTCALIKKAATTFELAKMAVTERARGRGIGRRLAAAAIDKARAHGAQRIVLESSTKLEVALALYRSLGFREAADRPSSYTRCNVRMELDLRDPQDSPDPDPGDDGGPAEYAER